MVLNQKAHLLLLASGLLSSFLSCFLSSFLSFLSHVFLLGLWFYVVFIVAYTLSVTT